MQASKEAHPDKHPGEEDKWLKTIKSINYAHDYLRASPEERARMDQPEIVRQSNNARSNPNNPEQPKTEQKSGPEQSNRTNPKEPEFDVHMHEPQPESFAQKFKRGAKRGAKAFAENLKKEKEERKQKQAEEIRQQAEIVREARAEEKKKKAEEAAARAEEKKEQKEKRDAAREAEKASQEKKNKPFERSKKEKTAERQAEKTEAQTERGPNPWKNWGEQSRASEKYFSENRLGAESKKYINESLQNEIGDAKDELAVKWFDENKYKIEARGIPINGLSQEAILRLAMDPATGEFSKEVLDDLEAKKDLYGDDLLKMENAKALGTEFGKDKISPESQFLMLHHLENRTADLYNQINKLESLGGKENREKAENVQKEIDNLFIARKDLAEKSTGRDLTKETLARVAEKLGYESKEEYTKDKALISQTELMVKVNKMNALAENEFAALSEKDKRNYKDTNDFFQKWEIKGKKLGLSQDQLYALSSAGYKTSATKKTGFLFFDRGIELTKTDGSKIKMDRKEFYNNIVKKAEAGYKAAISADGQKELSRRWDQEETGALIGELTMTMEDSVGGTEAAYERLKQNLIEEYAKNPVKEKSAEQQAKQDKEFGGEKKKKADILGFLGDALKGEGKFADLTGNLEEDEKILRSISSDYGMGISPKVLKGLDAGRYGKASKNRGGIISLFIELMVKNPLDKLSNAA